MSFFSRIFGNKDEDEFEEVDVKNASFKAIEHLMM